MARGLESFLAILVLGVLRGPGATDPLLRQFSVCAGRQVLAWRVDAKVAHRTLLHQARFVLDRRLAETAAARAEALAAECRSILLS